MSESTLFDASYVKKKKALLNQVLEHLRPIYTEEEKEALRIDVIDLAADGKSVKDVTSMSLPMPAGRFRSVVQGPDGNLYDAVNGDDIYELTQKP